ADCLGFWRRRDLG
ncbi:hypothetical protein, partial [Achromobacter phage kwar_LB4]